MSHFLNLFRPIKRLHRPLPAMNTAINLFNAVNVNNVNNVNTADIVNSVDKVDIDQYVDVNGM